MMIPNRQVLVVTGVGGMGKSIARRLGVGRTVLLADFNEKILASAAEELRADGFSVESQKVDVSDPSSVEALALTATKLGTVTALAHTAGLSPMQASVQAILAVDLVGTGLILEIFADVIAADGAGIVIASMAGHQARTLTAEQKQALATTPALKLTSLPFAAPEAMRDTNEAYAFAKQVNLLQVQAASIIWGTRGARINTISPGVISTPMGQQELAGPNGEVIRKMVDTSSMGLLGTPEDITDAAAFLLGPSSSFVTGTDLLVDGGVIAAFKSRRPG